MADLLIEDVEEHIFREMERRAAAAGITVEDLAREVLRACSLPSEAEVSAEMDPIRQMTSSPPAHPLGPA